MKLKQFFSNIKIIFSKHDISTDEGMMKLMARIRYLKIEDKLEEMGAQDGDTIILDDYQFEYVR